MRRLTLQRLHQDSRATFGQIVDEEHRLVCRTLERSWIANAHDSSCVPAGEYGAHRVMHHPGSAGSYEVFELDNVPGRSNIQIHVGNKVADSEGCILLGTEFGEIDGEHGVIGSRDAFAEFMRLLSGEQNFILTISNPALV